MQKIIITIVCAFTLIGCGVSKHCKEPQIELPEQIVKDLPQDSTCIADISWKEIIKDSLLIDIINKTLEYNKDILVAEARIREFERLHKIKRADLVPSIDVNAYADRETLNYNGAGKDTDIEVGAKLSFSWEIDLFGRLRWSNKEAKANYLKTIEAKQALQVCLIAEVASSYFELVGLDRELLIVQNTLDTRKENVEQAKIRFKGGLTSEIPYQQAQVEYAKTAAMIPNLHKKIKEKENEISFLCGSMPTDIKRSNIHSIIMPDIALQIGIPSELIKRRPDIREAEQALQAAMANAGYKWAERFPKFVFGFDVGFENDGFRNFIKSPITYLIGELTAPLFNMGKQKARYEAALEAYDIKRLEYEKRVILAFREVNDAVNSYTAAVENCHLMESLKHSSDKYVKLAQVQHINGHINYLDVLDAQRSYFNAEINHSNAIRDQFLALIDLYKSLGGGVINNQ